MKYVKKSINIWFWLLDKINKKAFIKSYPRYLRWLGIDIDPFNFKGTWISPTVFLDSSGYERIHIGTGVTISFDVTILTHDFSIAHVARKLGKNVEEVINKDVYIGNNVFIGAKSILLPGSVIGDDCIIGGGTTVHGKLEDGCIYAGNPCKKIGTIQEFGEKYNYLIKE